MEEQDTTAELDFEIPDFLDGFDQEEAGSVPEEVLPDHIKEIPERRVLGRKDRVKEKITYVVTYGKDKVPIAKRNGILLIKGREGTRKTFLCTCILMSRFTQNKDIGLNFNVELEDDELIVYFDTEMHKEETEERKEFFNELTKIPPEDERHIVYNIRDYTAIQRIEIISEVLKNIVASGRKVGILVVDQVADLLSSGDVNDMADANQVYSHFLAWMRLTNCLLVPIMHTNRGGTETDGRFGKLLDKKAFGSLLCTYNYDNNETEVMQHKGRKVKLDKFRFMQEKTTGHPKFLNDDSDLFL